MYEYCNDHRIVFRAGRGIFACEMCIRDSNGFFGSHSPLFGKNSKNLMKTDIRETDDAKAYR